MNPTYDFDRQLTAWLTDEAPPKAPMGVLDGALVRATSVSQRPAWLLPERWIPMQTTMRLATVSRTALYVMAVLVMALLLAVAAFVVGQQHLPPSIGLAGNGLIANDSSGQITLVSPTGDPVGTPLSKPTEIAVAPRFSPDGQKLAFFSIPRPADLPVSAPIEDQLDRVFETPASLVVVDVATGARTEIASNVPFFDAQIEWSHAGDALAYMYLFSGGRSNVRLVDLKGKDLGTIELADYPTWSPNDQQIAFRKPSQGVFVVDRNDTGDPTRVSSAYGNDDAFALSTWSADGTRLAYTAGDTPGYTVWTVNADGTNESQIGKVENGSQAIQPRFSPDGTRLSYLRVGPTIGQGLTTWVVANADGSDPHQFVTDLFATNGGWSPDGRYLLGYESGARKIVLVDAISGAIKRLGDAGTGNATWQRLAP